MLDGVDPEPVDAEVDPVLVDVRHPVDNLGLLGEEVVKADEVAVLRGLAGEGRVASVVVDARVVQPGRRLGALVGLGPEDRHVRERRRRVQRREGAPTGIRLVVEGFAARVLVRAGRLGHVGVLSALVVDDVGSVVGDDVEEDLHSFGMGRGDERLHLGVGAQMVVDLGEVRDPVTVVAGARVRPHTLDGRVLERRRQPDRRGAEGLDVVQLAGHPREVASVEEPLVRRVEASLEPRAGQPALVVGNRAVREAVGHQEVELLTRQRRAQTRARERLVRSRCRAGQVGRRDTDLVRDVVVGEGQPGRPEQDQWDVRPRLRAARAVALVPGLVDGHLELVGAGRDVELPAVCRAVTLAGQLGGRAVGRPVSRAANLVLQRSDERGGAGRISRLRGASHSDRRKPPKHGDGNSRDCGGEGRQTGHDGS